jgi:hypothetical protein
MSTFGPNEQYPFGFSRILVKSNSFKFEFLDFIINHYKLFMFKKLSIFSLVLPLCHLKPIEYHKPLLGHKYHNINFLVLSLIVRNENHMNKLVNTFMG